MTDILANCPFCGGDEISIGASDGLLAIGDCHCHTCNACIWGCTEAEAITAWNTRAPSPDMAEAVGLIAELRDAVCHYSQDAEEAFVVEADAFLARVGAA